MHAALVDANNENQITPHRRPLYLRIFDNSLFQDLFRVFIEDPLFELYINGPAFHGVGFWQGKPNEDICAELTSVSSSHWIKDSQECNDIIQRRFFSTVVVIYTAIYFTVLFKLAAVAARSRPCCSRSLCKRVSGFFYSVMVRIRGFVFPPKPKKKYEIGSPTG